MKTIFSKDFILVIIGQIISIFGNQILRYVIPLYLLNKTGSSALFGAVSGFVFVPMLLFYPIGGILADRFNKKNIMVMLDFVTGLLIFIFYLLEGRINIILLISVTMIFLYVIQGVYQPAVKASVPILVDIEYIMKANSLVDVINSIASMAGPVIGGILFSKFGLKPLLYISIGCFLISAVIEIFIDIPFKRKNETGSMFAVAFGDLKESFRFVFKKEPMLWKISLIYSAINLLLTSLVLISVPVLITQYLGFTVERANYLYGYAQGILALGAVFGGVFAGTISKKLKANMSPFILIGCALSVFIGGISLQLLNNSVDIYITMIIGFGLMIGLSTLFQIQIMTYIQMLTPKDLIGKVISCVVCICMCTNPIGQFIYGMIFEYIGEYVYLVFYLATAITIVIVIFSYKIFYELDLKIKEEA